MVVPIIVEGVEAPILAPSIVPPFMSVVVNTDDAEVSTPVAALKVKLALVDGESEPVAAVANNGKQVVSAASALIVTVPAFPETDVGAAIIACLWSRLAATAALPAAALSPNACVDGTVASNKALFVYAVSPLVIPT